MSKAKLNSQELLEKLTGNLLALRRYSFGIFLVIVAVLYAFLLLRINTLGSAQPSNDAVSSQVKAASIPHIDQNVVNQLKSLQDNSVSVQTLFNQARNNPFQE